MRVLCFLPFSGVYVFIALSPLFFIRFFGGQTWYNSWCRTLNSCVEFGHTFQSWLSALASSRFLHSIKVNENAYIWPLFGPMSISIMYHKTKSDKSIFLGVWNLVVQFHREPFFALKIVNFGFPFGSQYGSIYPAQNLWYNFVEIHTHIHVI